MAANDELGYIEFFYQFDAKSPAISIQLPPYSTLPEVVGAFDNFLRASGYFVPGRLGIIDNAVESQDNNAEYN